MTMENDRDTSVAMFVFGGLCKIDVQDINGHITYHDISVRFRLSSSVQPEYETTENEYWIVLGEDSEPQNPSIFNFQPSILSGKTARHWWPKFNKYKMANKNPKALLKWSYWGSTKNLFSIWGWGGFGVWLPAINAEGSAANSRTCDANLSMQLRFSDTTLAM